MHPAYHGPMRALLAGCSVLWLLTAPALAADLPHDASDTHLGVSECAGGPCHGSARPLGGRVHQNEHTIWSRARRHASAYELLRGELAASISRHLGLREGAHSSPLCLGCHADHAKRRAETHHLEDGVGCEACHGGAERWLDAHASPQATHAENVSRGLYPADRPLPRAELCLSCHLGTDERRVDHRMLGAGHPRLRFELEAYGLYQPPHWEIDEDYRERGKRAAPGVQLWALGQAVRVRETLDLLADPERNRHGIWPEFSLLNCYDCHHPIRERRRPPRGSTGLGRFPGTPRLDDSAFLMLQAVLKPLDPEAAELLRADTRRLHAAISRGVGSAAEIAREARPRVDSAIARLAEWEPRPDGVRAALEVLIDQGLAGEYRDYPAGEQALQAAQSLVGALHEARPFEPARLESLGQTLDALEAAAQTAESYRLGAFREALGRLREDLR